MLDLHAISELDEATLRAQQAVEANSGNEEGAGAGDSGARRSEAADGMSSDAVQLRERFSTHLSLNGESIPNRLLVA